MSNLEGGIIPEMEKHFCVTVYIIKDGKVLFIDHKKLGKWLPPGGHIEANESAEGAAKREVKEEAGVDIEFISCNEQSIPFGVQNNIISPTHEHFDVIYLAKPKGGDIILDETETNGTQWFNLEEINNPDFRTFDNTREWCNRFLTSNLL